MLPIIRNAQLRQIGTEAAANRTAVLALAEGLSEEQLLWRDESRRWSMAQILDHLKKSVEVCTPAVDKAIADARLEGRLSDGPFEQGIIGKIFLWYIEPPVKFRVPAPWPLRPKVRGSAKNALPDYLRTHAENLTRLEAADGVDLRRARFMSPFLGIVPMDLLSLFCVWTSHERRHIAQMRRVREQLGARQPSL